VISTIGDRAAALRSRVEGLRRRHPRLERWHRVGSRYYAQRGNHLASAVAFATVLAAVPLLMLLFSGAGHVLWWRASLANDLESWLLAAVPPWMHDVVRPAVQAAVAQRGSIASIGVLASVWAGMTWMSVVREAVSAMWGLPPLAPASPVRVLRDLCSLLVLVAAALVSLVLAATAGALIGSALDHVGLADAPAVRWSVTAGGLLFGTSINWCLLAWLLGRLPGAGVPLRVVARTAAVGAVAFEVLTVVTTLTVGAAAETVGGALFGTALAVLVFLFASGRLLLLLAAWTATSAAAPVVTGTTDPGADAHSPQPLPGSAPTVTARSAEP
jgi:membrane protein